MSILDGEIAEMVADALESANVPYDLTLTRSTPGEVDPDEPWVVPEPTITAHACRGFVDSYRADQVDGTVIQRNDRKVMVLVPTLSITPVPGDTVTARGQTYGVVHVDADPALATWTLQVRG